MNQILQEKTIEQMVEAIFALDLDPIKIKLMDKKEGHGWAHAQANHFELEYKRFLSLVAKFPHEVIAPSADVDKFWHAHILDTMKYAEDCNLVFGYFLHHFPYFGMRDEEDAVNLANATVNMQRLYEQEFGDVVLQQNHTAVTWCGAAVDQSSAWCGAASPGRDVIIGKGRSKLDMDKATAWCGAAVDQSSAWCGAAGPTGRDVIIGKGRPKLDQASVSEVQ